MQDPVELPSTVGIVGGILTSGVSLCFVITSPLAMLSQESRGMSNVYSVQRKQSCLSYQLLSLVNELLHMEVLLAS